MRQTKLPHDNAYTRIGTSKIHGVGVFAILPIKKGTFIFAGEDSTIVWVNKKIVAELPEEIRKIYDDFCINRCDCYGAPSSFNNLSIGWYLNHSDNPNVLVDENYDFYAKSDILVGEELTVDYNSFEGCDEPFIP